MRRPEHKAPASLTRERARFNESLIEHIPALRRYARALTRNATNADDLVQDTLERAMLCFEQYQPGTKLGNWLLRIMRTRQIDRVRYDTHAGPTVPFEDMSDMLSAKDSSPLHALELREAERALAQLPQKKRVALELCCFEGLSYREIAAETNTSVGTVQSRIARAREFLRALLGFEGMVVKHSKKHARQKLAA